MIRGCRCIGCWFVLVTMAFRWGKVQERLGVSAPTLSHHIHRMMNAGLIRQERDGRTLYCFAELDALKDVVEFLDAECCTL